MRIGVLITILILGLTAAPAAFADGGTSTTRQVEQLSQQGAQHFNEGEFNRAAEAFIEAYELRPIPSLLFNIGRCYQELQEWDLAIEYYERYVRAPDTDGDVRDNAMDRVQALRGYQVAAERGREAARDVRRDAQRQASTPLVVEIDEPSRTVEWATLGAGGAFLLGGVAMGMMARGNATRLNDTELNYDDRLSAQRSARTQGRVADGLFIVGTGAVATGVYLLFFRGGDDATSTGGASSLSITPWASRHATGAGVHLEF